LVRTAYGYGGAAHRAQEQADCERVVAIFARLCERVGAAVEVELFFDGAFRAMSGSRPENLRVRFAREVTADEMILDQVRARGWAGGRATVVTADAELGRTASAEGGKWMRVAHGTPPESVARRIEESLSR